MELLNFIFVLFLVCASTNGNPIYTNEPDSALWANSELSNSTALPKCRIANQFIRYRDDSSYTCCTYEHCLDEKNSFPQPELDYIEVVDPETEQIRMCTNEYYNCNLVLRSIDSSRDEDQLLSMYK
ncbi:hypothetical protein BLOT_008568 [Blomia tropicalis]|nr:hypothetical protein BLOT_008568 [Blomia tropicalis]